jgi:hypothetical protein
MDSCDLSITSDTFNVALQAIIVAPIAPTAPKYINICGEFLTVWNFNLFKLCVIFSLFIFHLPFSF